LIMTLPLSSFLSTYFDETFVPPDSFNLRGRFEDPLK
jgi:hypothetical protein